MGQISRSDERGDVENRDAPFLGKRRSWLMGKVLLIKGKNAQLSGSLVVECSCSQISGDGRSEASK
ncbi:hypothetical protein Elgi_33900 [Paenibacillus elgii]|nr:hypothetical protein Elgi_33900 [Paenibacillus elgii]